MKQQHIFTKKNYSVILKMIVNDTRYTIETSLIGNTYCSVLREMVRMKHNLLDSIVRIDSR